MAIPNSLYLDCPHCGEKRLHEVLRGRMSKGKDVLETTVKCQTCGQVHAAVVREPRSVNVPMIISEMGASKRTSFELGADELVTVGDEMWVGENNVIITAVEKDGKRVSSAPASEAQTVWAKTFDRVRVRISVNKHTRTLAAEVFALPDEEFFVGDTMTVGKDDVVIHNIKTKSGTVRSGGVAAKDIVRIYAKSMRRTYA